MKELKAKITQCVNERRTYHEQLEHIYEVVAGDNGYERYDHIEIIDRIKGCYDAYSLLTYATSDEYLELWNRREQEEKS